MGARIGSWQRCPRLLFFGSAAGLAITASAARADAQCETLGIRAIPCTADAATPGHFTSPLDNPTFVSTMMLNVDGPASVTEHAAVGGAGGSFPFGGWQFVNFEIDWHERMIMEGLGTVARGDGLRDAVSPANPDTPISLMGPAVLEWEARGIKLGRGIVGASARKRFAMPDDGVGTLDIGPTGTWSLAPTGTWSLAPTTILVPVSVIIGLPQNSGSDADRMEQFTVPYVQALFDDLWVSHAARSTGPNGAPSSYQGTWDMRTAAAAHSEGRFWEARGPLNIVRPDDVFAQCGVQFRVIEVIHVKLPQHISTFDGASLGVGTCTSTSDGQHCTVGGVGRDGICFQNECIVTGGTDSQGNPLGACGEAPRKTRLSTIITLAGAAGGTTRFTPDSGITGLVPGDDGLLGAAPLRVVFNYAAVGPTCMEAVERQGFNPPNTNRLLISLREQASGLVLAHELGHTLDLDHVDVGPSDQKLPEYCGGSQATSPGDVKNLMCASSPNFSTHIHGCQATVADASFNCVPDTTEHPRAGTCETVRTKAQMIQDNSFANLEMSAQAMPQPQMQMQRLSSLGAAAVATVHEDGSFECTGPEGAAIRLEISGHTLTEPRIEIDQFEWSGPGGDSIGSGTSVDTTAPLGRSIFVARVTDSRFPGAGDTVAVRVVDRTPPVVEDLEVPEANSCAGDAVVIPTPAGLQDACSDSGSLSLSGTVIESNGQPLPTPVPVVDGQATLEEGTHVIEWQATDASGNTSSARQTVEVHACWPVFGHDRKHTRRSSLPGPQSDALAWIFEAHSKHDDDHDDGNGHSDSKRRSASDHDCGRSAQVRSSPAVAADGSAYVGLGSSVYAVNPDGSQKWEVRVGADVASSPAVHDGRVFIGSSASKLLVLDAASGAELCAPDLHGRVISSPVVDADGTVYVGSEDRRVYALTADGCDVAWTFKTNGKIHSSPAIDADGNVYVGSDDRHLYALAPDGSERFRFKTHGAIDSSPSVGQAQADTGLRPAVFFGSDDENLYAVDLETGDLIWKVDLKAAVESSAAIGADGTLFVGSDAGWLWAFDHGGSLKWREKVDGRITASPAVDAGGLVYIAARSGRVSAFDGTSGDEVWRFDGRAEIRSSPAIGPSNRLFVSVADQRLLAFGPGGTKPGGHGHHGRGKCSIISTAQPRGSKGGGLEVLALLAALGWRRRRAGRG